MSKRKWKVYTTDELRGRFQPKPGAPAIANEDQKVVVPNLKRRNSAPPGMIHFPPGTFTASNPPASTSHSHVQQYSPQLSSQHHPQHSQEPSSQRSQQQQPSQQTPPSPLQQHELVTHARSSPTHNKPSSSFPYPSPSASSRLEKRRASLPFIPPASSFPSGSGGGSHSHSNASVPAIEAYLSHLQNMPLPSHHDDSEDENPSPKPPSSPTHPLPSFHSLLRTIREDADEEDVEIREIEERANGMQGSKSLPVFKEMNKSPQMQHHNQYHHQQQSQQQQQPQQQQQSQQQQLQQQLLQLQQIQQQQQQQQQNNSNQSYNNHQSYQSSQEPQSPSTKFYKNNLSRSNDNLPSLSRMSISDIIG